MTYKVLVTRAQEPFDKVVTAKLGLLDVTVIIPDVKLSARPETDVEIKLGRV